MARSRSKSSVLRGPFAGWALLALLVIVIDQLTKVLIVRELFTPGQRLTVVADWFDLTLAYNRGARPSASWPAPTAGSGGCSSASGWLQEP
jgi:signal peptidase II